MGQLSELHSKLLELRLEARAIAAGQAEEPAAPARGSLESRALADATENLWRVLDALYGKANFDPNQPRVPRGNPDGGQWTDDPAYGGGGAGPEPLDDDEDVEGYEPNLEGADPDIPETVLLAAVGHHYFPESAGPQVRDSSPGRQGFQQMVHGTVARPWVGHTAQTVQ